MLFKYIDNLNDCTNISTNNDGSTKQTCFKLYNMIKSFLIMILFAGIIYIFPIIPMMYGAQGSTCKNTVKLPINIWLVINGFIIVKMVLL